MTTIAVQELFEVRWAPSAAIALGPGPRGPMFVTEATGSFAGPRMRGTIERGTDHWHLRPDGVVEVDVRTVLRTEDGAAIAMAYSGLCLLTDAAVAAIRAGQPPAGPFRYRKAVRFETGDARYAWLNRVQAIGIEETGADATGADAAGWWVYAL